MDRLQKVERMRVMLLEMSLLIQKSGVSGDYLTVPKDSEKLRAAFVDDGLKWLEDLHKKEFRDAQRIRALLPEELWTRYENWGDFTEHREVQLLNEALATLKKAIRRKSRPDFFKKGKINGELKRLHEKGTGKRSKKTVQRHTEGDTDS